MFDQHWVLCCFPDIHVDKVQIQMGPLHEEFDVHGDWNLAGTGARPIHPLLQGPSRQTLLRISRRPDVQDHHGSL